MNELIVTPLGTVSPKCYKDKNCPGFLIESENKKILLDCGNGVSRLFDMEKDLKDTIIIISHLHKDHYSDLSCFGYDSYILKNFGYLDKKVKVYIPKGDKILDNNYGSCKAIIKNLPDYDYLMNFGNENYLEFIPYSEEDIITHGSMKVTFKKNPHQIITYSAKVTNNNTTIVYSSDTGFDENCLVEFAKGVDLLICESTFLRGQNKNNNNHLYAHEASMIAKLAEAKKLLLTHFYPTIDKNLYVKEAKELFENTEAAIEGKMYKIGGKNGHSI